MDEFTDETFKQGKFTPDRHNEAETKISFWQKLNLFNRSQHHQTSHNRSNSGSEQSITFSPKTQKHDRERLFEQLIFPGVERSAVLSEYWMQNLGPGYENIQELIRQKDTKKIQIKLNDLAAIKNIWVDEFLLGFLGITDQKVLSVLEQDYQKYTKANSKSLKRFQTFVTPTELKMP